MSDKFPLFPNLSEEAKVEAEQLINSFKERLKKVTEEVLDELCINVMPYIESDAWSNFRNELLDGFRNYNNRKIQGKYDFKKIREEIYREYKDDIIKDLDQDHLEEISRLKEEIKRLRAELNYFRR